MRFQRPPEPGFARREAKCQLQKRYQEEGAHGGNMVSPMKASDARPKAGRAKRKAEKEGFEPSRQGFSPPNALAGRRLQPLGHFSRLGQDSAPRRRARPRNHP